MIYLSLRVALAAVFLIAAAAKLRNRGTFQAAVADFGLPERLVGIAAVVIPALELLIAVALLVPATAVFAAALAAALLSGFTVAVGWRLSRGERPPCNCFGAATARPIGPDTVVRNVLLMAAAGGVLALGMAKPGWESKPSELSATTWTLVVLSLALAGSVGFGSWLLLNLARQQGRLLLRVEELEAHAPDAAHRRLATGEPAAPAMGLIVGAPAPDFELPDDKGRLWSRGDLMDKEQLFLVFTDPDCGPCKAFAPQIETWQDEPFPHARVVAISKDPSAEAAASTELALEPPRVLIDAAGSVAEKFLAFGTPSALVVGSDGRIASSVAAGSINIVALHNRLHGGGFERQPAASTNGTDETAITAFVGLEPPPFALPSANGTVVESASLRGRPSVLLFWNSSCGFCQRMTSALLDWAGGPDANSVNLLLIAPDDQAASTFRYPVLLDEGFSTGRLFGIRGTPSAVLLDEHGRIRRPPAVGEAAIIDLLKAAAHPSPQEPLNQLDSRPT